MSRTNRCKECGKVIPADSPGGFCGQCLLGLGLARSAELGVPSADDATQRRTLPENGSAETDLPPEDADPEGTAAIPAAEKTGDRIGRYRLLQEIGHGGCGVVYMAEQEEPVRRRVALKVIKLGMDTRQVVARFEAERQALALMDHPNIAKVLDAGATETGRPYFVMELVRGIRITDYCDQNRLSTSERLKLFRQVCQAIQHAHQKGIIHRDIKPSNILVTLHEGVPVPKVIDFGIAKATQGRLTDQTLFTAFGQFIGTPAYMSPEQAEMSEFDIDTRSDIYSLGVLLYELLTGKTPFDERTLLKGGLEAMRRIIRQQEPPRPSARLSTLTAEEQTTVARCRGVEAPRLLNLLRGDLDWIVMKCLEKERNRRYSMASDLASDIDHHLRHQPVVARPPSIAYQVRLFARRNAVLFGAACFAVIVLLCATVISLIAASQARAHAERRRKAESTANQQAEAARSALRQVERERNETRAAQHRAELSAHGASMLAARLAMDSFDFETASSLIEQTPEKFREWEWRFLSARLHRSREIPLPVVRVPHADGPGWAVLTANDGLAIDQSGTQAVVYSSDSGRLFLIDLHAGTNVATLVLDEFQKGTASIVSAQITPTGNLLVLTYAHDRRQGQALFLDISTRSLVRSWQFAWDSYPTAVLHSSGRHVVIGDLEKSQVFDLESGKPAGAAAGPALAFLGPGTFIARAERRPMRLEFHSLTAGSASTFDLKEYPSAVAASPDGAVLAIGLAKSGDILVYRATGPGALNPEDLPRVTPLRLRGQDRQLRTLVLNSAADKVAILAENGLFELWDIRTKQEAATWLTRAENSNNKWKQRGPFFLGSTGRLASLGRQHLHLWDPAVGDSIQARRCRMHLRPPFVEWSIYGNLLASSHTSPLFALGGSTLMVWDCDSLEPACSAPPIPPEWHFLGWTNASEFRPFPDYGLAISANGRFVAQTQGKALLVHDLASGTRRDLGEFGPASVDLTADGRRLLVSNPRGHSLIDFESGAIKWHRPAAAESDQAARDGSEIARFALQDKLVLLLNAGKGVIEACGVEDGATVRIEKNQPGVPNSGSAPLWHSARWSPRSFARDGDGDTIAIMGPAGSFAVYKLAAGEATNSVIAAEISHTKPPPPPRLPAAFAKGPQLALDLSGTRVAWIAASQTIALSDAGTGVEVCRLTVPPHLGVSGPIESLAFVDSSRVLIALCGDRWISWNTEDHEQKTKRAARISETARLAAAAWKTAIGPEASAKEYSDAFAQTQRALELSPWADGLLTTQGILQFRLGDPANAVLTLRSALARQPADLFALGYSALALEALSQPNASESLRATFLALAAGSGGEQLFAQDAALASLRRAVLRKEPSR